jgi:hypothetical protein
VVAAPLVVLLAVLGACATGASDRSVPTTTRRLRVVATTMILGDVARTVAGDRADVTVLTGPTDDPSAFTLAPGPAAELTSADVILRIDPDYEQGLTAAIDQARAAGVAVYDATPAVAPMPGTDGRPDPHVWLDADRLTNVASQVGRLLATRSGTDPSPWQVGAAAFATTMTAADEAAQAVLNPVPDLGRPGLPGRTVRIRHPPTRGRGVRPDGRGGPAHRHSTRTDHRRRDDHPDHGEDRRPAAHRRAHDAKLRADRRPGSAAARVSVAGRATPVRRGGASRRRRSGS